MIMVPVGMVVAIITMKMTNSLSVYIHWPFCLSKCPYCDFNSHVAAKFDYAAWLKAYLNEIEYFRKSIENRYIKTIFFGGGTPSLMDPSIVKGIIDKLADIGKIDRNTEITLEANPNSVEAEKFLGFRKAGVNRISIGVQSLIAEDLKKLGRKHSPEEAIRAIKIAKEVFDNYSFDLIYAREGQSLQAWQDELCEALELAGNHISLYQLTIEKGTPFYALHSEGKLILPENDTAADMYDFTTKELAKYGYNRYEISNYAKDGFESRHNLAYWHYDEYLGIGPGAHSRMYDGGKVHAVMNHNKPEKWLQSLEEQGHGIQTNSALSDTELLEEIIMMGLRLEGGITEEKLRRHLGLGFDDAINKACLEDFIEAGFVSFKNGRLALTSKGLLMHSYIVPRLL